MREPLQVGRYSLLVELASGGMATVYLGRAHGAAGFGRTVAIKRLHAHFARDPKFVSSFIDEARLVARVQHPNVVPTLDVVEQNGEIFLVLEYVQGDSLAALLRASARRNQLIPIPITLSLTLGMLNGLHAAHEATDELGRPLDIVHRDMSPQNVLIGADGVARVVDFGVAKASRRIQESTSQGQLKGKIPYMAPDQIAGSVTRQSDIYSAGVVLWETLTCRRLFCQEHELALFQAILTSDFPPPSAINPDVPPEVDRIVLKALAANVNERYATARHMAEDIDECMDLPSSMKVGQWVENTLGTALVARRKLVSEVERGSVTPHDLDALQWLADSTVRVPHETQLPYQRTCRIDYTTPVLRATPAPTAPAPKRGGAVVAVRASSTFAWVLVGVSLLVAGSCASVSIFGQGPKGGVDGGYDNTWYRLIHDWPAFTRDPEVRFRKARPKAAESPAERDSSRWDEPSNLERARPEAADSGPGIPTLKMLPSASPVLRPGPQEHPEK
ncbi:serine/threonine protein kinase [Pendulispora albinea]|uniref:Serine/threonine protein kinase n=1 Tax=Pendulispora albinea TaxID=2741071 RepID=A0ABZ2M194_9BACT